MSSISARLLYEDELVTPTLHACLQGNLFRHKAYWACLQRDYLTVECPYTISHPKDFQHGANLYLTEDNAQIHQVQAFEIHLSGIERVESVEKPMQLRQQHQGPLIPSRRSTPGLLYGPSVRPSLPMQLDSGQQNNFGSIQFLRCTKNNRRALRHTQETLKLRAELYACIFRDKRDPLVKIKVGESTTPPLVVLGAAYCLPPPESTLLHPLEPSDSHEGNPGEAFSQVQSLHISRAAGASSPSEDTRHGSRANNKKEMVNEVVTYRGAQSFSDASQNDQMTQIIPEQRPYESNFTRHVSTSCSNCHRSGLDCDDGWPCIACQLRGLECSRSTPGPIPMLMKPNPGEEYFHPGFAPSKFTGLAPAPSMVHSFHGNMIEPNIHDELDPSEGPARSRVIVACVACRGSKRKCGEQRPCDACKLRGLSCSTKRAKSYNVL